MKTKHIKIFLMIVALLSASLACTIIVDYDGDGVVPSVTTEVKPQTTEIISEEPTQIEIIQAPTETQNCPLSVEILNMFSIPEGFSIPANSNFLMVWEIQNNGCADWPQGMYLQNIDGDQIAQVLQVPVPALTVGEKATIEISMTTQNITDGTYQSVWQLSTSSNEMLGPDFLTIIFIIPNEENETEKIISTEEVIVIDAKEESTLTPLLVNGPDIVFNFVQFRKDTIENGTAKFAVSVLNIGNENMEQFKIQCILNETNSIDERILTFVEVDGKSGEYCTLDLPELNTVFSVTVTLDPYNAQMEINENNNIETFEFTYTP